MLTRVSFSFVKSIFPDNTSADTLPRGAQIPEDPGKLRGFSKHNNHSLSRTAILLRNKKWRKHDDLQTLTGIATGQ